MRFAKAYIAYMHFTSGAKSQSESLSALKNLYNAMHEFMDIPDPVELNSDILDRTTQVLSSNYSEAVAYSRSLLLQRLALFLQKKMLTTVPIKWTTNLKSKRNNKNRDNSNLNNGTHFKLPSPEAFEALGYIFNSSNSPSDIITTSSCAILCGAPSRPSELMSLSVNCEIWRNGDDGESKYGLRWVTSKGGQPTPKWIIPVMYDVVQKAVQKLKDLSLPARKVAKWYEDNPGMMYLPPGYEHLRTKEFITSWELAAVLMENATDQTALVWCKNNNVKLVKKSYKRTLIDFESVQRAVLNRLPRNFPWLNKTIGLKYSDSLFLIKANQLYDSRSDFYGIIEPVPANTIRIRLGARSDTAELSIFEKYKFYEIVRLSD